MSTFNLQVVALDRVFYDGPCDIDDVKKKAEALNANA